MTIHEARTPLPPSVVIDRARSFFLTKPVTSYGASAEAVGEACLRLHFDMGEIVIGATREDGVTTVRGSASRGGHLLTRFLTTLPAVRGMKQVTRRHGLQGAREIPSRTFPTGPAARATLPDPSGRTGEAAA